MIKPLLCRLIRLMGGTHQWQRTKHARVCKRCGQSVVVRHRVTKEETK